MRAGYGSSIDKVPGQQGAQHSYITYQEKIKRVGISFFYDRMRAFQPRKPCFMIGWDGQADSSSRPSRVSAWRPLR
jgi:hypothetical protein